MPNPEGLTEYNFRIGLITYVEGESAQCLLLHSRLVDDAVVSEVDEQGSFSKYGRRALDTDLRPDFNVIDILEEDLGSDFEIPSPWTFGQSSKVIKRDELKDDWSNISVGSLIHIHDYMAKGTDNIGINPDFSEYCVRPEVLSDADILRAIQTAIDMQSDRTRKRINDLVTEEKSLLQTLETVDPQEFRLFDGAKKRMVQKGPLVGWEYIEVPDRVINSAQFGIQLLCVDTRPIRELTRDYFGNMLFTMHDGKPATYWMPGFFPLEEVDEHGYPKEKNKQWVSVEIGISNPVRRHQRGMEEQKAIIEVGGARFVTQPDEVRLVGNQGFGGTKYIDFLRADGVDPPYERTEGLEELPVNLRGTQLIVAIDDLDSLMELIVRLPGFE